MRKLSILLLAVLVSILFHSCDIKTEKELSSLTFNVWQEGTSVPNGLIKIRDVIAETNPDIVCFVDKAVLVTLSFLGNK